MRVSSRRTEIGELWHQVTRRMHGQLQEVFRECSLPPPVFDMLRAIAQEPGITVSELSRRVAIVKSHVSRTVDHLERHGYVRKQSDPNDQRLIRLYLLPPAEVQVQKTDQKVRSAWAEVLADLPEEDLATVERGLRILLETLERHRST